MVSADISSLEFVIDLRMICLYYKVCNKIHTSERSIACLCSPTLTTSIEEN